MNRRPTKWAAMSIAVLVLLLASGCIVLPRGRVRAGSQMVELGGAESVRVRLEMGAGELAVAGGATGLMDAEFTYTSARWKPEVTYEVSGTEGELLIRQPSVTQTGWLVRNNRYEWAVQLNEKVPIDLSIAMGAGESQLKVGELELSSLDVDLGAGDCVLDLSGSWENDLDVSIQGGVGQVTVRLPKEVGARVEIEGGLGQIDAPGLRIDEGAYVNDAYGASGSTIHVEIEGGVGKVTLEIAE